MADKSEAQGTASKRGRRSAGKEKSPKAPRRLPTARQVGFFLCAFLVAVAVAFYVWWNVAFGNHWLDNGVYAVVVTLVGFGASGMWICLPSRGARAPVAA